MKNRNVKTAGIALSFVLPASAFLILQLSGTWRVRANTSSQPTNEGPVSSRIIAEHPPVELVEKRDDHTRIWEIAREVETTHPDGSTTVDTVESYIHEKASGLCYREASGSYVPSVAEWRETPDGFVIDRCGYGLTMGKTMGVSARYTVEGNDLLLRPAHLIISDGMNQADLATLRPESAGFISPDNPSVLRFASAFGEGYDLEYVAEKGGFHQNLIISNPPQLPEGFNSATASIHLYTELNLDQYLASSGCEALVEGEPINAMAADLVTEPSRDGAISFAKDGRVLHAFSVSQVMDSSGPGALDKQTSAEKRFMKDASSGKAYLVESVPFSYFTGNAPVYPVTWDYESKSGSIGTETWDPRWTYRITGNLTVSGTLTILPGTTVKLDSSKKITVSTGGKVIAKGEPYNYITFTKSSDNACGEPIPGAPAGGWDKVFDISSGSSYGSVVQYCKFGHGNIALNIRMSPGAAVAHNVFNDMNCAIQMQCASVTVHNNLMTNCVYYNIHSTYVYEPIYTNNTIHGTSVGICDYGSCYFKATDNLFSNCSTGIYVGNYYSCDVHHNRYYNVPTFLSGASGYNNVQLQSWPYVYCAIGSYFLNPANGEYEQKLKDNGSRPPSAAGLSESLFTVLAPNTISQSQYTSPATWSQITHDTGDWVDIGYHHCRTDIYLESGLTVSGSSGVLTIEPGVVVGIRGDKYLKASNEGRLLSVGDPSAGGFNVITCSRSLSMNIESPWFADTSSNPYVWIYTDASEQCKMLFTRTMWLGWGVWLIRDLDEPVRDNVFSLSYYGIHASVNYSQNKLLNNLLYHNYYGAHVIGGTQGKAEVSNCTFDSNATGLKAQVAIGGVLPIRDSLFTRNDAEGIWMDAASGEIVNYYNAFWENGVPITGSSPGPGSLEDDDFEESPYASPLESGWEACYKLNQDSPVVDGGSRWAEMPAAGAVMFSTSVTAERDIGIVDVGYHYGGSTDTDGDGMPDVWEDDWSLDPEDPDDANDDGDSDGLNNLYEFWHGTDPTEDDTDGDGLDDGDEVGPRSVDASRKLNRGWGPAVYDFKGGPYLTNPRYDSQNDKSGITVSWWTYQKHSDTSNNRVYYRCESDDDWRDPVSESSYADLGQNGADGCVNRAQITDLNPGQLVRYYVQSTISGSSETSIYCLFRAMPDPADELPMSFIVYGDNRGEDSDHADEQHNDGGFNECHREVVDHIVSHCTNPGLVLHVGDYVQHHSDCDEWREHFFDCAAPLLGYYPILPVPGNHEYSNGTLGLYGDFFTDPQGDAITKFSIRFGAYCHLAGLDSNPDDQFQPQASWLEGELDQLPSCAWSFVAWHHPPFAASMNGHHYDEGDVWRSRKHFVHVLERPGVAAAFAGHNHFYDRMYKGINYVTTGGAGATYLHDQEGIKHDPHEPAAEDEALADEMRLHMSERDVPEGQLSSYHEWFHYCLVSISSDEDTPPTVSVYDKDDNMIDAFAVTDWDQVVGGASEDWRYWTRDQSDFPNDDWKKWGYDETGWATGLSCRMGYEDYDIDTDLRNIQSPPCGSYPDYNLWYYFRQPFYVSGSVTKAELFVSRDDTCTVYIAYEGQGGAGFTQVFTEDPATAGDSREICFKRIDVTSYLQPAKNHVLSVKVKQVAPNSSDLHFDAVLFIKY